MRLLAVAGTAVVLTLANGPTARADVGVALDLGPVTVTGAVLPGATVDLPTFDVRNPGDEPGRVTMEVSPLHGQPAITSAWLSIDPGTFRLDPRERRPVDATIVVPDGTPPGRYIALLKAVVVPEDSGAGTVGVAAASRLTVTVASAPAPTSADLSALSRVIAALVALVLLTWLSRRYQFSVVRRRSE